jgi:hypothetical protein
MPLDARQLEQGPGSGEVIESIRQLFVPAANQIEVCQVALVGGFLEVGIDALDLGERAGRGNGNDMIAELNSARLYLPDEKLRARMGNDATPMAEYIEGLKEASNAFWAGREPASAKGLLIAIGVKPGKSARVWCEPVEGEIPKEVLSSCERALEEVVPLDVREGPVAFALEMRMWGRLLLL